MGEITKIQWCHHTFNPWVGCQKVAPGCVNCYAESDMDKRRHFAVWGRAGTRVKTSDANWYKPLKWNREAAAEGVRRRVFCASLADVFEDWRGPILRRGEMMMKWDRGEQVPVAMDDVRAFLFRTIDATPNLDWLLLTKRPENVLQMWPDFSTGGENQFADYCYRGIQVRRNNVWLGTSISDQSTANKAIPELLKCRDLAPVLFLSAEPLLGPIDLTEWLYDNCCGGLREHFDIDGNYFGSAPCSCQGGPIPSPQIDWVIVGGESGHNARPCDARWISDIRAQCDAASVPCFVKQLGSNAWLDSICFDPSDPGSRLRLEHTKGGDPAEWPEDLRVREFPPPILTGPS